MSKHAERDALIGMLPQLIRESMLPLLAISGALPAERGSLLFHATERRGAILAPWSSRGNLCACAIHFKRYAFLPHLEGAHGSVFYFVPAQPGITSH
ncbi:MAG TPA: hypothetical protein VMA74_17320, partial [Dyella sp.]|uniref:hypothetical protein n=1 Tax=Dyella sp. TaxID=1869338 RepID=UPI002CCAC43A